MYYTRNCYPFLDFKFYSLLLREPVLALSVFHIYCRDCNKNWSFLQSKERLAGIFNKPHLEAYRRPKRLRDRAVSTKFKTSDNTPVAKGCEACTKPKCSWCKQMNKIVTFAGSSNNKLFLNIQLSKR